MIALTDHERNTPLWLKLEEHYVARLAQLRMDNDNTSRGKTKTAQLRGRIEEVKAFLRAGQPAREVVADAE